MKQSRAKARRSTLISTSSSCFSTTATPIARTRAFVLIAKNVSWDSRKKIDRNIDRLLKTVDAEQATTVRQCIQSLPLIAAAKPGLRQRIAEALRAINPEKYPVRMRSILTEDIKIALAASEK